ncbi:hypothetical protein QBC34DRAFT_481436 [Podospora aff. communis PSN243]|uniref:Galactose oxidase-like Early set domain-containing protein n=1 Tax=Podospora aff. communis PSN243 TaxID=3040156 RepID=A0AAV9H784_9PEZI|nr:hypothetical protein QBC34DRAFT_481436 [Podospora aff. communis PSN243]
MARQRGALSRLSSAKFPLAPDLLLTSTHLGLLLNPRWKMAAETVGRWSEPFELSNVAVHVSLLPNGKVLYWGRRTNPRSTDPASYDELWTRAFVWDPATKTTISTANEPRGLDGNTVNLFCAGHSFLPDGTLLIAGGHIKDGWGVDQACVYDAASNRFTPKVRHNKGRWYPSVLTLPDGRALVISGSYDQSYTVNNIPEIWPADNGTANPPAWIEVADPLNQQGPVFPLYPRMHVAPNGRIIVVGPLAQSWWLDIKDPFTGGDIVTPVGGKSVVGRWVDAQTGRKAMFRDYCPSVMYDTGKIMYIGGGLTVDSDPGPTNEVEFIDLNQPNPRWTSSPSTNMRIQRRQFNATVLPDGTVLVNGGTKGPGFNDLSQPVLLSELWDPAAGRWSDMASESVGRCYHGVSLLLPDATVLSAGSGEYGGAGPDQNMTNAQIFSPPYLFRGGPRPSITAAPSAIVYGRDFTVTLGSADTISKVSWVRLGSVTHCRNMNQSLMFLNGFRQNDTTLTIPAPANANLAPPGHYMLYVLNARGVPSIARIIRISSTLTPASDPDTDTLPESEPEPYGYAAPTSPSTEPAPSAQPTLAERSSKLIASQSRPPITVGLTPACPYGLGPCWGGAYDALRNISDIETVNPVPDQADSVAFVYPKDKNCLPDIDIWREELKKVVNNSYELRGVEMTLSGAVKSVDGELVIDTSGEGGKRVVLKEFTQASQIKWDVKLEGPKVVGDGEVGAYERLEEVVRKGSEGGVEVKVTGTLQKGCDGAFSLDVREFEVAGGAE